MKCILLTVFAIFSVSLAEDLQAAKDYSAGYNKFISDVYKELLKSNNKNFIMSPLSIDTVLALVTTGARDTTRKELSSALRLPESTDQIKEIFENFRTTSKDEERQILSSINKVYIKEGFKISNEFRNTAVNSFGADVQNIDFEKPNEAAAEINHWVQQNTADKIRDLIDPKSLDEYTRSVLINALVFKADWMGDFRSYYTAKRPFKLNRKEIVETDMMKQLKTFKYYESPELKAKFLELPYSGIDVSMHIVLPDDEEGLSDVEDKLSGVLVTPDYKYEAVEVYLPKFKIETSIDFKPILQAMGVTDAFEDYANFRGIAADRSDLKISEVVQKASIEVNEQGTIAAAGSSVTLPVPTSVIAIPPKYKVFDCDRPFLFYLRLNKLGINIFVGRYVAP